jgi:ribosomal protein L36
MKVVTALKKRCQHCYFAKREKKVYVLCEYVPKHKQRQKFSTLVLPDWSNFPMPVTPMISPMWLPFLTAEHFKS